MKLSPAVKRRILKDIALGHFRVESYAECKAKLAARATKPARRQSASRPPQR